MNRKSKTLLAGVPLIVLNTVIATAKAGEKDPEGLTDEIKKLQEFKSSPLSRLADDMASNDSAVKTVLAKAYKSAVRSNDKVALVFVIYIYICILSM